MDEFDIERHADPELSEPILIEGLPGVGHVGKLAADHLIDEGDGELLCRIYSEHFPPQVTVEEGTTKLASAEFYAVTIDGVELVVLVADHQAGDGPGHYRLTDRFLDIAAEYGCERAFALGGIPTGELIEESGVIGAVNDADLTEPLEDVGVEFREDEPAGGIVGVSGLLLGLGGRRGLPVACLMGETSGYLVDPKSAHAVLDILSEHLGFDIDYAALDERAEEMEEVMAKMREMEQGTTPSDEDLRYIG
ncbi:proteasome assembly chaperone family protein [Natronomonas sp. EA1]|uniref:proteasome assembly chaperone family protein n=1 Tax=Natronomonas sp. EA1 TaxID=3421655 RepID=UPI003EBA1E7C